MTGIMEKNSYVKPQLQEVGFSTLPLLAASGSNPGNSNGEKAEAKGATQKVNGWTEGMSKGHGADLWADDEDE